MSDPTGPAAAARAALQLARGGLCGHGVPRLNCADHRGAPESEEGDQ